MADFKTFKALALESRIFFLSVPAGKPSDKSYVYGLGSGKSI
jgi:hypothetical protein